MRFRFADYELDTITRELLRAGRPVAIQRKPFALLAHLVARAPNTASRQELLRQIWPDQTVTLNSVSQVVSLARRALGDGAGELLVTVRGRGFRIAADVSRAGGRDAAEAAAGRTDFFGRSDILDQASESIDAVLSGQLRILVLSGEPGIGKTRTAERISADERLLAAEVVWGRCLEDAGSPGLWPWLQVLEGLSAARSAEELAEMLGDGGEIIASVVPWIADRLLHVAPPSSMPPEQRRFRFLAAVAQALLRAARRRPLVVVIDDIHFADETSLALLDHLSHESREGRLLVIATYRTVEAPPNDALEQFVTSSSRSRSVDHVSEIHGLGAADVMQLWRARTNEPLAAAALDRVLERTGGSPLLVEELAQAWKAGEPIDTVPSGVAGRARSALESFEPATRSLLETAAVIGREFDLSIAAAAAGLSAAEALAAFEEAEAAGLVEEREGRFRFVHMLVAEAIQHLIGPIARVTRHHRVAEAMLAARMDERTRHLDVIARHYRLSFSVADAHRVLDVTLRAADAAERRFAFELAGDHLETAIRAAERSAPNDHGRRFGLLLRLADLRRLEGARERRLAAVQDALALARRLGPEALGEAAVRTRDVTEGLLEDESTTDSAITDALEALGECPSPLRARLLARQAHRLADVDPARARQTARRAVEMARDGALDADLERELLCILHYVLAGPDDLSARESLALEIEALGRDRAPLESDVIVCLDAACDRLASGDRAGADRWRATAAQLASRSPVPAMAWHLGVYDSAIDLLEGRADDALARIDETLAIGLRIDHPQARRFAAVQRGQAAERSGDPKRAWTMTEPAVEAGEQPVHFIRSLGALYSAASGQLDRTRALIRDCTPFETLPRDGRWLATMANLAQACADARDIERARELEPLLAGVPTMHGVIPGPLLYSGSIAGAHARLLDLLGRREEAIEEFRRAVSLERAVGALALAERSRVGAEGLGTNL